jgi:hypothetical protein
MRPWPQRSWSTLFSASLNVPLAACSSMAASCSGGLGRGRSRRRRAGRPARALPSTAAIPGQRDVDTSRILALPEAFLSGKPYPAKACCLATPIPRIPSPAVSAGWRPWPRFPSSSPSRPSSTSRCSSQTSASARSHLLRALGCRRARPRIPRALASSARGAPACGFVANRRGHSSPGARLGARASPSAFPWADYRQAVLARLAGVAGGPMPCWAIFRARACGVRRAQMAIAIGRTKPDRFCATLLIRGDGGVASRVDQG